MSYQLKPPIAKINCPDGNFIEDQSVQLLTDKYKYNEELTNDIHSHKIDSDTQYRKGYYESEQYGHLLSWHNRLLIMYYLLAIALTLILFFSPNKFLLSTYQLIAITIGLLVYPHVIHYILKPVISIYRIIVSFLPKNVYNSI